MANKSTFRVAYRRSKLTNYHKRLRLLKSGKTRLVIRKSNNATLCQMVDYTDKGDKTLVTATSLDLPKYGYKGHTGNIPAAYLTGFMCGLKAKKKKIAEVILDTGLYRSTKGSVIYAALKGVIDGGIKIAADPKIFPEERRIKGYHIANYGAVLKAKKPEEYERLFFKMLEKKLEPEKFVEHFDEVKKRINGEFS